MKLKVKVIRNLDEYERKMELHQDDPLIHDEPKLDTSFETFNFPDEAIEGYRIDELTDEIEIFLNLDMTQTCIIKYDKDIEDKLDEIINVKNKLFRDL